MVSVINDFNKKVSEIELYFELVSTVTTDSPTLYYPNKQSHKYKNFDPTLKKVMKANIFLILYNMVESAITLALIQIYDEVSNQNIAYKDLSPCFQKIWLKHKIKNKNNMGASHFHSIYKNLPNEIFNLQFDLKEISGNINPTKIKEFAERIGFSSTPHYRANNGVKLFLVKDKRNSLAHGNESFADCGQNYTPSQLKPIVKETVIYMRSILKNIEKFLATQGYLA